MNKIKDFLEIIGINLTMVFGGFVGSVIMVKSQNEMDFKSQLLTITSGTLCANFMTPIFIDLFNLGESSQFGIAFILGYLGLKGMEKIVSKYISKK